MATAVGTLAQRFPDTIQAVGGPMYSTTIVKLLSGFEYRNINRARPIHRWNVAQGVRESTNDALTYDTFFRKAKGRGNNFRFKDWGDYAITIANSKLTLITSTTFQLYKVYGSDEPTFQEERKLSRIVTGTYHIFQSAIELTEGGGAGQFTINVNTGVVTFGTAPGANPLTAALEFDVLCRFDFDEKRADLMYRDPSTGRLILNWDNIEITEVLE